MHDTELCAHESACDRPGKVRDLCLKHYTYEGKPHRKGLAPLFRVYKLGHHGIADIRDGTGYCVRCLRRDVLGHGNTCKWGNASRRRSSMTGWTPESYDQAVIAQSNRCFLCPRAGTRQDPLEADHCHGTGTPRKLLCGKCNRALGLFNDDPDRIRSAAKYLEDHRKEP